MITWREVGDNFIKFLNKGWKVGLISSFSIFFFFSGKEGEGLKDKMFM